MTFVFLNQFTRNTRPGFRSFVFHFMSFFTSSEHQIFCLVLFCFSSHLLSHSVILRDVIGWQRGLHIIGCCLLFVRILNKLLSVPKSELCFICVRERSWGISFFWERLFNDDRNILYNRITLEGKKNHRVPTLVLGATRFLSFRT